MNNKKNVIVGIDPGTTSGLAVLDLKGNLKKLESGKDFSSEELINSIVDEGSPILIATDKGKVPSGVEEICSNFNAKTFVPEEDLSLRKKKELTQDYDRRNLHERDALASALYAYNNYQNLFRNIQARAEDLNLPNLASEIKELVVTEKAENISEAIQMLVGGEEEKKEEKAPLEEKVSKDELKEKIANYRKNILKERKDKEKLRKHNEKLKERVSELENAKESLEQEIRELEEGERSEIIKKEEIEKRERKLRFEENQIRKLKEENQDKSDRIKRLETVEELRKDGKMPLREVGDLSEEELKRTNRSRSLKNSALLVGGQNSGSKNSPDLLEELGIKLIIGNFADSFQDELISRGIWVLPEDETEILEGDGIKYIYGEVVEEAKKADKGSFLGWLKRYRERNA